MCSAPGGSDFVLSLDISPLYELGLVLIEDVLRRSCLERLHICCALVDHRSAERFVRLLQFVQWLSVRSLVLSGDDIES